LANSNKSEINNRAKTVYIIICLVLLAVAVGLIFIFAKPAQRLELPDAESVDYVEMEQFNDRLSVGTVIITDKNEYEKMLSTLSGSKKTWRQSINDAPYEEDYLLIKIYFNERMRGLYLYSQGNRYYIEEPYAGIYKGNKSSSDEIYKIYTENLNKQQK